MFLQSKEEIVKWLDEYEIKNYIINSDLSVDVNGDVDLYDKKLTSILVKFNIVYGNFKCPYNQLTSLQGAPKEVGGNFNCAVNQLTSLQGAPEKVGGNFYCGRNILTSLQGSPEKVGGNFNCYNNLLTSLQGAPKNKLKGIIEDYPHLVHTLSTEDLMEII
jgi:hypothetical protein